jgi:hypothetical protein
MADDRLPEFGVARRDLLRGGMASAALVWTTPKIRSVRLLAAPGTPTENTTTPTTLPPPSACPTIAVDVFANGFSLPGRPYDAGDTISVSVGFPASSPAPTSIDMLVERESPLPLQQFPQNASFPNTLTFTFPETGIWFVQVQVNDGLNATFTASCSPRA